jgi:hypothetical protein
LHHAAADPAQLFCSARTTKTGSSKRQLKTQSGNNLPLNVLIVENTEPSSKAALI